MHVTGIDISRAAIRFAEKRFKKPIFRVMDAHVLEFPDASFDLVVSTENFEHLRDQRSHLRELRRVLAPGGLCFIAAPNPEMFQGVYNPYHEKENTFAELSQLLKGAFSEFIILENMLPHKQDRPHGVPPDIDPLVIFGLEIDKTWLSNTHSFFMFCR